MSTTSNAPQPPTVAWDIYPGSPKPDVDMTIVARQDRRPFVCPVCGGRGTVLPGFYDYCGQSTTCAMPEMCRSCQGAGIVWG